jgi:hypothetical protein
MKLVHFLLGSLVASLTSAAYTTVEPDTLIGGLITAFSGFADTYSSEYLYRGIVLGIQEDNTNTDHACYLSYLDVETVVVGLSDYFTNLGNGDTNSVANTIISSVWYRPATYFKLIKKSSEIGQLFFVMYSECYFDDMIISVGRTINSFSGGLNTAVTSLSYAMNLLDFTDTTNPLVIMYSIVDDATFADDYVQDFGLYFATIIKNIFNIEVPEVQYEDY